MFVFLLLLLSPVTDALVRLQNSVLYDEVDFQNVAQITTDMCAAGDCKLYASIVIAEDFTKVTKNIIITNPNTKEELSIYDLSKRVMMGTMEKGYFEIGKAAAVTITNKNDGLISAPLSLWIVSSQSPYYKTAEVFEPLNLNRKNAAAPVPITILSAAAFTIIVNAGESNSLLARTTGYDAIDRNGPDNCYAAMDYDFGTSFFGATFSINGPLLTIAFDTAKYPKSQVQITGSNTFNFDRFPALNQPVFISSPGFVCGSPSSYQVSHQKMYPIGVNPNADYTLKTPNKAEMKFHFEVDVVTDENHRVIILDNESGTDIGLYGNFKDNTNLVPVTMETNSVKVSFTPGPGDSFFGMRVWVDELGKDPITQKVDTTTTTTKMTTSVFESTTSSSERHQFAMLIIATIALIIA